MARRAVITTRDALDSHEITASMLSGGPGTADITHDSTSENSTRLSHGTSTCIDATDTHSGPASATNRIASRQVAFERTHVPPVSPFPDTSFHASWSSFRPATLPAFSYQPRRGSLQRSHSSSSPFSVDNARQANRESSGSPSLSPDRTFAFQSPTRASRQPSHCPGIEMSSVPFGRGLQAIRKSSRPPLPHKNSRVRLLGASSARIDIDRHPQYSSPPEDDWPSKRASRGVRNRVKLVWVYSFVLTVFVLTAGLYPLGRQFDRIQGSSRLISGLGLSTENSAIDAAGVIGGTSALDAVLRCRMDTTSSLVSRANAGANALSGAVNAQEGTDASLSNDIWGWKRHKGIVYANSHNDEMHGDRAFVSIRFQDFEEDGRLNSIP
jgi:hypothetical protein